MPSGWLFITQGIRAGSATHAHVGDEFDLDSNIVPVIADVHDCCLRIRFPISVSASEVAVTFDQFFNGDYAAPGESILRFPEGHSDKVAGLVDVAFVENPPTRQHPNCQVVGSGFGYVAQRLIIDIAIDSSRVLSVTLLSIATGFLAAVMRGGW